jgi:hypothetical protein
VTTTQRPLPHRLLLAAAALALLALSGCGSGPIVFRPVFGSAVSPGPRLYEGGNNS